MGDCFYCSKAEPVVQTKAGKIRGFKMKLVDCLEKCLICRHIRRFAD